MWTDRKTERHRDRLANTLTDGQTDRHKLEDGRTNFLVGQTVWWINGLADPR